VKSISVYSAPTLRFVRGGQPAAAAAAVISAPPSTHLREKMRWNVRLHRKRNTKKCTWHAKFFFLKSLTWGPLKRPEPHCDGSEQPRNAHGTARVPSAVHLPLQPPALGGLAHHTKQITAPLTPAPAPPAARGSAAEPGSPQQPPIPPGSHPQRSLRPGRAQGRGGARYLQRAGTPRQGTGGGSSARRFHHPGAPRGRLHPSSPIFITSVPI